MNSNEKDKKHLRNSSDRGNFDDLSSVRVSDDSSNADPDRAGNQVDDPGAFVAGANSGKWIALVR